ncbi:hypothetical protein ACVW0P_002249 [Mucilaginibacter sp. UYNi724]
MQLRQAAYYITRIHAIFIRRQPRCESRSNSYLVTPANPESWLKRKE